MNELKIDETCSVYLALCWAPVEEMNETQTLPARRSSLRESGKLINATKCDRYFYLKRYKI